MERSALSSLAPSDAAVALRSLPRRAREQFRPDELTGGGALAGAAVPRGGAPTPAGLIGAATTAITMVGKAIDRTLVHDDPDLDVVVFDRAGRDHPGAGTGTPGDAIAALQAAADRLADDIDRTPLGDWDRPATVGSERITALELLKEAVASARTYLDQLGTTLVELRRNS